MRCMGGCAALQLVHQGSHLPSSQGQLTANHRLAHSRGTAQAICMLGGYACRGTAQAPHEQLQPHARPEEVHTCMGPHLHGHRRSGVHTSVYVHKTCLLQTYLLCSYGMEPMGIGHHAMPCSMPCSMPWLPLAHAVLAGGHAHDARHIHQAFLGPRRPG